MPNRTIAPPARVTSTGFDVVPENVTDAAQRAQLEGALKTISTPTGTAYEEFLKQLEADGTI